MGFLLLIFLLCNLAKQHAVLYAVTCNILYFSCIDERAKEQLV